MLVYQTGDLFATPSKVIAHGVNCMGAFNAGIAKQIRHLFPPAYLAYLEKTHSEGWKLGDVQFVPITENRVVANCATQKGYGYNRENTTYLDYDAIALVFDTLCLYSVDNNVAISIPRIGAGLAGGDWDKINHILQQVVSGYNDAHIVVYSL